MSSPKLPFDNTAGLAASVHQLYIALEQCLEMDHKDQCVIIEKFGDVTVTAPAGGTQLEVKAYDEDNALSDSHPNFWNTLKNWLNPALDISHLKALVLHTTQPIGPRSFFNEWNTADLARRLEILEAILVKRENEYLIAKNKRPNASVPQALEDMRYALDKSRTARLSEVVKNIRICAEMPELPACYSRILGKYGKGIPEENTRGYIGALLEFIIRPDTIENQWTITYDTFAAAMVQFSARFGLDKRTFPTKHLVLCLPQNALNEFDSYVFVTKIKDINFHSKIPSAITDYTGAHRTWLEEFAAHQSLRKDYGIFEEDVRRIVKEGHELASLSCNDIENDSKIFYLKMTGGELPIPTFPNKEPPNISYRNGVIHAIMETEQHLCWKLAK